MKTNWDVSKKKDEDFGLEAEGVWELSRFIKTGFNAHRLSNEISKKIVKGLM